MSEHDLVAKAREAAQAAAEKTRETAEGAWSAANERLGELQRLRKYASQNPVRTILLAFGAGIVVARLLRK
ncbi:MAG: hypothetical protein JO025_03505 [Verrucomicrobia bacterium]|nr:hypothetical protein [Verrucomicrobiota bacterium]